MSLVSAAFGRSGGLAYHLTALKYAPTLWRPFAAQVQTWLETWNPPRSHLLIFGPSAGYTLPAKFLASFDRVTIVEPDPIAVALFRRRFPWLRPEVRRDGSLLLGSFARRSIGFELTRLRMFLHAAQPSAVLFSNLLGQVGHAPLNARGVPSGELRWLFRDEVTEILSELNWASYHDILSASREPRRLAHFEMSRGPLDLEEFCADAFAVNVATDPSTATAKPSSVDVVDHQTQWLSIGRATSFAWWRLRPTQYHLIGFTGSAQEKAKLNGPQRLLAAIAAPRRDKENP